MKIWVFTNTPSPYQVELLDALARTGACTLDVCFMDIAHRGAVWQPEHPLSFRWRALRGLGPRWWSDAFRVHPEALRDCSKGDYDLYVLSGQYTSFTVLGCVRQLCRRGKPWTLWLERPWPEEYRPTWTRSLSARVPAAGVWRRRVLSGLLRKASAVLCIGSVARDAYREMGIPPERLHVVPYCVDIRRFASPDPARVAEIRRRLGDERRPVYLFSGQLIPRKGVDLLITAFERLAAECPRCVLLILGDGSQRPALEDRVRQTLANRVYFLGQVSQAELPIYYGAADVFVFPSRYDGWGVVVNEACAAGLPIITTDAVGAARDLVEDGASGFIVRRDDEQGLYEKMKFFAEHPEQIRIFGARSRELARLGSVEFGAERFLAAARAIAQGKN